MNYSSNNTLNQLVLSTESPSEQRIQVESASPSPRRQRVATRRSNKKVENAVYAYIRAIRALGRTTVNAMEISNALSLSVSDVAKATSALRKKGVK